MYKAQQDAQGAAPEGAPDESVAQEDTLKTLILKRLRNKLVLFIGKKHDHLWLCFFFENILTMTNACGKVTAAINAKNSE